MSIRQIGVGFWANYINSLILQVLKNIYRNILNDNGSHFRRKLRKIIKQNQIFLIRY